VNAFHLGTALVENRLVKRILARKVMEQPGLRELKRISDRLDGGLLVAVAGKERASRIETRFVWRK
jgi:hypothetical protein